MGNDGFRSRPEVGRPHMFRRVLVGYDGSDEAQEALRVGTALAADLTAAVRVLVVVRPPAHAETPEELEQAEAAERQSLSMGLAGIGHAGAAAIDLDIQVVFADDPASAIAEYAEEHGFDLVVVGRHGREQGMHRGIGHQLDELLKRADLPVLVT